MISLNEAIRAIQKELITSERERQQAGDPVLFKTEKLTIELSCAFTESNDVEASGKINAISVVSLDSKLTNTVSSEKLQKITIEFSVVDSEKTSPCDDFTHEPPRGEYPHQ